MLYSPSHRDFSASRQVISTVTGYGLALGVGKKPPTERALVGGELVLGLSQFVEPRVSQVVDLVHVSRPMVEGAVAILMAANAAELLQAIKRKQLSLLEAAVLAKHPQPQKTLVETYLGASAADQEALAKTAGPAAIWDALISPYV